MDEHARGITRPRSEERGALRRCAIKALAVIALVAVLVGCATRMSSRDVLWHLVSACLDPSVADYCGRCRSPLPAHCPAREPCRGTTDVWAQTAAFVAIRDLKMCGCPADFVHGLVMPRVPVSGVEDVRRPAAIWPFAWKAALTRIEDRRQIALAVNPPHDRAQDHLHVHIVRLRADARARLAARTPERVSSIETVWDAAARHAARQGLTSYGVIVVGGGAGDFLVAASPESPEDAFTMARCRPR